MTARERRAGLRADATTTATAYGGVLSRRQLADLHYARHDIAREVAAGRWRLHGRQTVALHNGDLGREAQLWRAVWEVGEGVAVVDGVTALQAAGMTGFDDDRVHVSVVHRHDIEPVPGVVIHKVRHRDPSDVTEVGLPRTKPAAAAIRAAHWAVSDRQAALLLVIPVQQRLTTGPLLTQARLRVRGRTRRATIGTLVADIADGAHSLGELDVAAMLRSRGIQTPSRQELRILPRGRAYLDLYWDHAGLVVEIDGSGHRQAMARAIDALRQNELTLSNDRVLRIDLLGLRIDEDAYLDQIRRALARWGGTAAA